MKIVCAHACRKYGVGLAFTPMFISSKFVESESYRRAVWQTCKEDRPLAVQFCGNDAATLVKAAHMVHKDCDIIDLNLGACVCPRRADVLRTSALARALAHVGMHPSFFVHCIRACNAGLHKCRCNF